MITVRQIERDWTARNYEKLFRELTAARPEGAFRFGFENAWAMPAAAMAIVRLEELSQVHVPLYTRLVRALVAGQDARDGGWGDVVVTALCVRALLAGSGNGLAIDRGLAYLADLQKPEGIWPAVPIRRLQEDPYTSAVILYELGGHSRFRSAVRFDDALAWFEQHTYLLDPETKALWTRASLRCRTALAPAAPAGMLWS